MKLENYKQLPSIMPIIVQKDIIYPFMIIPIFLEEKEDIEAINSALKEHSLIFVAINDEINTYGTIGTIIRKVELPDNRIKVLFQGITRGKILEITDKSPTFGLVDKVEPIQEYEPKEMKALLEMLKEHLTTLSNLDTFISKDFIKLIDSNKDVDRVIDLIASALKIESPKAYEIFKEINTYERMLKLIHYILEEIEKFKLKQEISDKVSKEIQNLNREHLLRQELKLIQKALGMSNDIEEEIQEYYDKLEKLKPHMPKSAYKEIKKQIDRLSKMHPDSAEATTTQNYIEWALEVPFGEYAKDDFNIQQLKERLDSDHFGLKKPKEKIIEYFGAKELATKRGVDFKGTIICFVGPPGVGKTSLANSIAKALNRELVRIALGGLDDVNELRGHRRTYVGSMPGRIAQGLINAKQMNPVIVLDEIDKISRYRGDPTAVLLEILDPEQNSNFRDLYLNFDLDLSKIIFIATANDPSTIPMPLKDRMEMIFVGSYTPQEKFEIAKRYLIPQEMNKHSIKKSEFSISDGALKEIIDKYTKEAGVRNLRRVIQTLIRKAAIKILQGEKRVSITIKNLKEFLEKGFYGIDTVNKKPTLGVVNGLAWTPVGGDILKIEATKYKGKGQIILTGKLGEVMKESAHIAFTLVKTLIDRNKIPSPKSKEPIYYKYNIHIHVPEGATPKDGPSAGITITTAISSILSNKKVRPDIAMTGEITLTGEVLPIGGLKEKLIAAHKAKIKKVLIPYKNYERDLDEIPDEVKNSLEIVPVRKIEEVLNEALIS